MERTCTSIVTSFNERVTKKDIIPPHQWIDASLYLNVLIGDEHDKLYRLEQECARYKAEIVKSGESVAHAKAMLEAEDIYREAKKQKAFIGQIEEFIRLAKKQATLKDNEIMGY